MRLLAWILRAALFFLLFGLALNNQHESVVYGLFGTEWRAPMIVLMLASFIAGVALALLALGSRRFTRRRSGPATAPAAPPSGRSAPTAAASQARPAAASATPPVPDGP